MSVPKILGHAETLLETVAEAGRWRWSRLTAPLSIRCKSDLRGTRCNCPRGLKHHFVHSEGLREIADFVIDYRSNVVNPARGRVPIEYLTRFAGQLNRGNIIHLKADLLGEFAATVLPGLKEPVVLVTGDSDYAPLTDFSWLLDHPRIGHWFVQNADAAYRHSKLTPVPIGLDNPLYNKLEKRIGLAVDMLARRSAFDSTFSRNEAGDQALLNRIIASGINKPIHKNLKVLCTFHMNHKIAPDIAGIPSRIEAYSALVGNPLCHFPSRRLAQEACWRAHENFAFQASPHGNGLDCFRTWESLALGTIPIVKKSPLDLLYEDEELPVMIVESWHEVTPENLQRWRDRFKKSFDEGLLERLSNSYWVRKIRATARTISTNKSVD
jgi:hypothetical protein